MRKKSATGFRTENFKAHLELQHKKRWQEYNNLPAEDKHTYFEVSTPRIEIIYAHYGAASDSFKMQIAPSIIDDTLEAMLLYDDFFCAADGSQFTFNVSDVCCNLKICHKANFKIIVGQVALRSSFHMTANSTI